MIPDDKDFESRLRLDVRFEAVVNPTNGAHEIAFCFDPARYEILRDGDNAFLKDLLDNWVMPLDEALRLVRQSLTHPWTGKRPLLANAREYVKSRRQPVLDRLNGAPRDSRNNVDRSEVFLSSIPDGAHGFAVISVDLVGSTNLSKLLDPISNARVIGVVLDELAAVAPLFHAQILKFTGDGILAYLPPDSFLTANDNAMDCALTMRGLIQDAISPALVKLGYPPLEVRIGIDSGTAIALTVGHESSKQHRDLIGKALNLACKVQASGSPGEIRVGQIAYQNMHTMWKRGCEPTKPPDGWAYTLKDGRPYGLYVFVAEGAMVD